MDSVLDNNSKYNPIERYASLGHKYLSLLNAQHIVLVRDPLLNIFTQCSWQQVKRIVDAIHSKSHSSGTPDCLVAVGGGKTLDLGKAIANQLRISLAIVPTLASTDAPCSALSVMYTPEGDFQEYSFYPLNPTYVFVDSSIIAKAPNRFLASGIGDAMATFYEADVCFHNPKATTCQGGRPTLSAYSLAELCKNILFKHGLEALKDVKKEQLSESVDLVIEANTLLSGLGFESGGLAAAHAIHNGLTIHHATHHKMHGEKVAFGVISQLCMEGKMEEAYKVAQFFYHCYLPVTLTDLNLKESDREGLENIAKRACQQDETIHNHPFPVTPDKVYDSMLEAHRLGMKVVHQTSRD
ncbi:Glycerol dehydrogenase [Galdieria sulphuraria]|nr:Glycerol dehydrogenase [Galdieria sulphuraria]